MKCKASEIFAEQGNPLSKKVLIACLSNPQTAQNAAEGALNAPDAAQSAPMPIVQELVDSVTDAKGENTGRKTMSEREISEALGDVTSSDMLALEEENTASEREAALTSESNMNRYRAEIDGVFDGSLPERQMVRLGDTPELLMRYGASARQLTMTQDTARKIAYPKNYLGGNHNLGIPALKQLPLQINNPLAILKSSSQPNSLVLLTEWTDINGLTVVVPIHLDRMGSIELENRVVSAYGKGDINSLLG